MMIIVNRVGDNITGSINGKPFGVTYTDQRYEQMKAIEQKAAEATTMEELKTLIAEIEPLTVESYKELVEHAKGGQWLHVNNNTGQIFLAINGMISSIPVPKALVDRIITSVEKKIDVAPLVKCWARFIREIPGRPKYTAERGREFATYIDSDYVNDEYVGKLMKEHGLSREAATAKATTKQVAITQEGLIVGYKVSREILHKFALNEDEQVVTKSRYEKSVDADTGVVTMKKPEFVEDQLFEPWVMCNRGDAFYCGADGEEPKLGHFIRVGKSHWLEKWEQVGYPGQKGLHCGGLRYIDGYADGENAVIHNIFVDPMDIYGIAGLDYGQDGAMTVKRYFVHSSFAGPNRGIYHSSHYAKLTDKEYAALIEQAVADHQQKVADLEKNLLEQKTLLGTLPATGDGAKVFIQS